MLDMHLPTTDGRMLILPRFTEAEANQAMNLNELKLTLPVQPPSRNRNGKLVLSDPLHN